MSDEVAPGDVTPGDRRPERLLVAPRLDGPDGQRYVFARWEDWPHPAMLSTAAPVLGTGAGPAAAGQELAHIVARLVGRLGLSGGTPHAAEERVPVRMAHPRFGGEGLGWLRPVGVTVEGDPQPDAMLAGVELLTLEQALEALPTEVERVVLRAAAKLLD
jgi:hypothetical protein